MSGFLIAVAQKARKVVLKGLAKMSDDDRCALAHKLIDKGYAWVVANNPELLEGIDHRVAVRLIEAERDLAGIVLRKRYSYRDLDVANLVLVAGKHNQAWAIAQVLGDVKDLPACYAQDLIAQGHADIVGANINAFQAYDMTQYLQDRRKHDYSLCQSIAGQGVEFRANKAV